MTRFLSFRRPVLLLGLALTLSACDASLDTDTADLTASEADEAAEIVAEALAEDGAGLVTSTRDLTASVTDDSLADGPYSVYGRNRARCRGGDYELTYDETTGTHFVSYACSFDGPNVQKSYDALLTYQYRDAEGGFVPRPVENWDDVDSVAFDGGRDGSFSIQRGAFSSAATFEQQAQWTLSNITDATGPGLLSGQQQRDGTRIRTTPRGSVERDFSVALSGEGIEVVADGDGEGYVISGVLDYALTMEVTRGDRIRTRTVEGTIEFERDGRVLLRLLGVRGVWRISLDDGSVTSVE
jgi:hypothetical protein